MILQTINREQEVVSTKLVGGFSNLSNFREEVDTMMKDYIVSEKYKAVSACMKQCVHV